MRKITSLILAVMILFFAPLTQAEGLNPVPGLFLNDLRMIPVQSGGRLKPFDEFARETILSLTGSRSFSNFDPSEMLVSMMVNPTVWMKEKVIRVSNVEVNKQLLLDPNQKFFSPEELMHNNAFLQYAQGIESNGTGSTQVTNTGVNAVSGQKDPRGEEMKRVVSRMSRFQMLISGKLWAVSPPRDGNPESPWGMLSEGITTPTAESQAVYGMLKSYLEANADDFKNNAARARLTIEGTTPEFSKAKDKITAEVFYNRLRPFLQAMIFYLFAGVMWLFAKAHPMPRQISKFLTILAISLHAIGFALRCYVAGRPPVTNMYESIIWVSLGVMVFGTLLYAKYRQSVLMTTATFLSGLALFAADAAPMVMDPTIRPLVPVLRSNYWLTIHVLTITISYGAFMLAMGISNVALFQFRRKNSDSGVEKSQKISLLNMLSYRALMFGTVLLAAGTILGGVWADYSWGRFWGWDPKEVWALIALLSYMAVLHGRYAGWVGVFALPLWTVICFSTVVMAWYGVNFVLGVGLHSYGFSSGGQALVSGFITVQSLYCIWIALEHRANKNAKVIS